MANIPVERTKAGVPPWLWIVGLLLLALLAWFLISAFGDDDDVVVDDTTEVIAPVDNFDMSDVYVTRVVGDNTFFVAATEGGTDERLVYLEEEADPGNGVEGRYDVTAGQHLSITGTMEPTPADLTPWGLTTEQAGTVGDQYIRATSLTVLDGAVTDDAADAMADDTASGEGAGLAMLTGDLSQMAGQAVALDGVRVTGLAGDSTFYVGTGAERTLVVLESLGESQDGPGNGADGVFDVNEGDVVNINGTVRAFARGMRGTAAMGDPDMSAAESRRYVIVVNGRDGFSKQ